MELGKFNGDVKRGALTPDGQADLSLEVSGGEGGDVAGVCGLIRLLCVQNQQRGVGRRLRALELNTLQEIRRRWERQTKKKNITFIYITWFL